MPEGVAQHQVADLDPLGLRGHPGGDAHRLPDRERWACPVFRGGRRTPHRRSRRPRRPGPGRRNRLPAAGTATCRGTTRPSLNRLQLALSRKCRRAPAATAAPPPSPRGRGRGVALRRLCLTINDQVAADLKQARPRNQSSSGTARPERARVDVRQFGGRRRRARVGRRPSVGRRVGVDQEPAHIDPRIADRPDLPVDDGGDALAGGEQVAEPEVAVHDGGRQRGGHRSRATRRRRPASRAPGRDRRSPAGDTTARSRRRARRPARRRGRGTPARGGAAAPCTRAALRSRSAITAGSSARGRRGRTAARPTSPSRNDITNNGGTSGGSPASSQQHLGHRDLRRGQGAE